MVANLRPFDPARFNLSGSSINPRPVTSPGAAQSTPTTPQPSPLGAAAPAAAAPLRIGVNTLGTLNQRLLDPNFARRYEAGKRARPLPGKMMPQPSDAIDPNTLVHFAPKTTQTLNTLLGIQGDNTLTQTSSGALPGVNVHGTDNRGIASEFELDPMLWEPITGNTFRDIGSLRDAWNEYLKVPEFKRGRFRWGSTPESTIAHITGRPSNNDRAMARARDYQDILNSPGGMAQYLSDDFTRRLEQGTQAQLDRLLRGESGPTAQINREVNAARADGRSIQPLPFDEYALYSRWIDTDAGKAYLADPAAYKGIRPRTPQELVNAGYQTPTAENLIHSLPARRNVPDWMPKTYEQFWAETGAPLRAVDQALMDVQTGHQQAGAGFDPYQMAQVLKDSGVIVPGSEAGSYAGWDPVANPQGFMDMMNSFGFSPGGDMAGTAAQDWNGIPGLVQVNKQTGEVTIDPTELIRIAGENAGVDPNTAVQFGTDSAPSVLAGNLKRTLDALTKAGITEPRSLGFLDASRVPTPEFMQNYEGMRRAQNDGSVEWRRYISGQMDAGEAARYEAKMQGILSDPASMYGGGAPMQTIDPSVSREATLPLYTTPASRALEGWRQGLRGDDLERFVTGTTDSQPWQQRPWLEGFYGSSYGENAGWNNGNQYDRAGERTINHPLLGNVSEGTAHAFEQWLINNWDQIPATDEVGRAFGEEFMQRYYAALRGERPRDRLLIGPDDFGAIAAKVAKGQRESPYRGGTEPFHVERGAGPAAQVYGGVAARPEPYRQHGDKVSRGGKEPWVKLGEVEELPTRVNMNFEQWMLDAAAGNPRLRAMMGIGGP